MPPAHCLRPPVRRPSLARCGTALLLAVSLSGPASGTDNPFVDGMVRMMENFGFVDPDRPPPGVPYLPNANAANPFPMTGLPGVGGPTGGMPMTGLGGMPGAGFANPMAGLPGTGGTWPGNPWMNQPPGSVAGFPWAGSSAATPLPGLLDGIWETNKGGVVIIRADAARLYLTRHSYQDYLVRYDDKHFWWRPRDGSKFKRYRYEMREGRMVLADTEGNLMLLRRRR